MACTDEFPAGLQTDYDYRATFDPPLADTVVARVRFTNHRGDSVFGTFEDLDPDPGDAEQFGTVFPLAGAITGAAVTFTLAAPGVRVYHEGTQSDGRIEGACRAAVVEQPAPFPCTFRMLAR